MRTVVAAVAAGIVAGSAVQADNWPQWRGPEGTGVSTEHGIPTRWSDQENVLWKVALRGRGTSSPIVWDDKIFLTSQIGRGRIDERGAQFPDTTPLRNSRTDTGSITFLVQAFHRSDGRVLWEHELAPHGQLPSVHRNHNLASSSVVTDGHLVYAWFGNGQLVALDLDGRLAWERHIGQENSPFDVLWGHGSSPVLYEDSLILLCDHPAAAYLLSLNKHTGEQQWKVDRGEGLRSYSTPLVVTGPDGDELIVNSSHRIEAIEPSTGELLWFAGERVELSIPMPVYNDGVLYTSRGYASGPYLALQTGGRGDVSDTHLRWRKATRAPYVSSLLLYEGLIYMATESGIVTVIDAGTGEPVWRERVGGVFMASPVAADGYVYLLSESGETVVLEAGRQPRVVERNALDERSLASPAISNGQLFIRTDRHLICIGR